MRGGSGAGAVVVTIDREHWLLKYFSTKPVDITSEQELAIENFVNNCFTTWSYGGNNQGRDWSIFLATHCESHLKKHSRNVSSLGHDGLPGVLYTSRLFTMRFSVLSNIFDRVTLIFNITSSETK